jgi:hypothetical protein
MADKELNGGWKTIMYEKYLPEDITPTDMD